MCGHFHEAGLSDRFQVLFKAEAKFNAQGIIAWVLVQRLQLETSIDYRRNTMTTSMADKQNESPTLSHSYSLPSHQGKAFKLQLGHEQGPFLSKDVMYSNQKSSSLLAAREILQSHLSMSSMMGTLAREEQRQSLSITSSYKVENWFSKCDYMAEELGFLERESRRLAIDQKKLKSEIKNSFSKLVMESEELSQSFAPLFRNLLKTIREQSNEEKNDFEAKKRDIEELGKFRNAYLDGLVGCESRLMKIEAQLGLEQGDAKV